MSLDGETWLICGGRDFIDEVAFDLVMQGLIIQFGAPKRIVQGGASGADTLGRKWAYSHNIKQIVTYKADWETHGKAAGPIRNKLMLDTEKPDKVIAFPGGRGTANMVTQSIKANVPVYKVKNEDNKWGYICL